MSMFEDEEFSSFFDDDFDMDSVPDNPFELPPGTYHVEVTDATVGPTQKDPDKLGLTLKFQIVSGIYQTAFPFTLWIHKPKKSDNWEDPQIMRAWSTLKMYFMGLGFSIDELKSVTPQKLVGRRAYVRTVVQPDKDNPEFKRVQVRGIESEETVNSRESGVPSDDATDIFKP